MKRPCQAAKHPTIGMGGSSHDSTDEHRSQIPLLLRAVTSSPGYNISPMSLEGSIVSISMQTYANVTCPSLSLQLSIYDDQPVDQFVPDVWDECSVLCWNVLDEDEDDAKLASP